MPSVTVMSHPVRVRGLKLRNEKYIGNYIYVAPRAGAWIETEFKVTLGTEYIRVAPRAGAWIETNQQ